MLFLVDNNDDDDDDDDDGEQAVIIANGNDPGVIGRVCAGQDGGTLFAHTVLCRLSSSSSIDGNGEIHTVNEGEMNDGEGEDVIRSQVSWMFAFCID